jgi:hypothetical protein
MQNNKTRIQMISSIVENVAIFRSHANLSVNAACSPWLRNMLVASFNDARTTHESPGDPKRADLSRRLIPKLSPPLLRAPLSKVSSETGSEVISIFQEYLDVG